MQSSGKLRMQSAVDMGDDERYRGKVKKWERAESSEEDEEGDGASDDEDDGGFSGVSDEEMEGDEGEEDVDEEDEGGISGEDDGFSRFMGGSGGSKAEEDEDETEREMRQLREEEKQALEGITQVDDSELEQAKAVQEQKTMWEDLLELRIQAQKALSVSNQFPKEKAHQAFVGHSEVVAEELRSCQAAAADITRELRAIEAELVHSNEEASEACGQFGAGALDSDIEGEEEEVDVDSFWRRLSQDFKEHRAYRDDVIAKWGRKAQLSRQFQLGTEFKAFNKTINQQIDEVLSDSARLVRRTQLQRSLYQIVGDAKPEPHEVASDPRSRDKHLEKYDQEIFDDSDFYSKLLRELIDSGSKSSMDAANSGREFLKKTKRQVDTKASKGRKLRYDVHAKLVNFMPAVGLSLPANANELFANLFGNAV